MKRGCVVILLSLKKQSIDRMISELLAIKEIVSKNIFILSPQESSYDIVKVRT